MLKIAAPRFRHDEPGTPASAWDGRVQSLPRLHFADLMRHVSRAVVVAPHPDDESLGAGGLIAGLASAGVAVQVVVCTDGSGAEVATGSDRAALGHRRLDEVRAAVSTLTAGGTTPRLLGLTDGALTRQQVDLDQRLGHELADADLIVGPWPSDGHPDHRACGESVRRVAPSDAIVLEYPIWYWHWGSPTELQEGRWVAVPLSGAALERKQRAVHSHRSQIGGRAPVLSAAVLQHFARDEETFVVRQGDPSPADRSDPSFFDAMYRASPDRDPWGFRTEPAEQDRFDHLARIVTDRRVERCLEVACANGELTRRLAAHCDHVLAIDASATAIDAARTALGRHDDIELRTGTVPGCLSGADTEFDTIVVSEVGYYFDVAGLEHCVAELAQRSSPAARMVLCHWSGTSVDHVLDAAEVHRVASRRLSTLGWDCTLSEDRRGHQVAVWERSA